MAERVPRRLLEGSNVIAFPRGAMKKPLITLLDQNVSEAVNQYNNLRTDTDGNDWYVKDSGKLG